MYRIYVLSISNTVLIQFCIYIYIYIHYKLYMDIYIYIYIFIHINFIKESYATKNLTSNEI
jgi:hypothetical protein